MKTLVVLVKDASHVANSLQMILQSMARVICLFTCGGSKQIAGAIVVAIVFMPERKKEQNLVKGLLNITVNGSLRAIMECRLVALSVFLYQ